MKIDLLAIGVHPDDIELSCSGTLLRYVAAGKTVGLLDLTRGELGSRGSAEIRDREAAESARLMGAAFRENLGMADGFFEHSQDNLLAIIRVLRRYQPEIVLLNAVRDRHPDHGRAAKLEADACYYSGLLKIETYEADGTPQEKWRPRAVYHYIQDRHLEPDFVIDISEVIDRKMEVVSAFGSQFYNPKDQQYTDQPQTPISGKQFFDYLRATAATYGRAAGYDYAEAFHVQRTPGVRDLFALD